MDEFSIWMKTWWPIFWAALQSAVQIGQVLLTKTYAKKEDVQGISEKVNQLEAKIEVMPTQGQVTDLLIELESARGEMKELRAQIQPIQHLSRLLLEQRLKDDK